MTEINVGDSKIIILKIKGDNYNQGIVKILQKIVPDYNKCIYVSVNKPYSFISHLLPKHDIDISKIVVIDCVSDMVDMKQKESDLVRICGGPSNFTQMSIAIEEVAKKGSGNKVVVLDSLSTLLIYSSEQNVAKFIEFLIGRLRSLKVAAILLGIEGDLLAKIEKYISPSCDGTGTFEVK